jgi:hypothetical protein
VRTVLTCWHRNELPQLKQEYQRQYGRSLKDGLHAVLMHGHFLQAITTVLGDA